MKRIVMPLVLMAMSCALSAQIEIKSRVIDEEGEPLFGATILEEGTENFEVTDANGDFTIRLETKDSYLVIDYLSYETYRIKASDLPSEVTLIGRYKLEDLIIEAVRAEGEPVAYSTLDKEVIAKNYNGEQPIFILEELSPSLFSFSESGTRLANYGNIRLRGIGQERINMTLNGVPLNDMIDHGVFFSNFTDIGNSIESMQVQRGVGMSTNGTSSYAGSINFETVNLSNRDVGASAEFGFGSFNSKRFNASASTGLIDNKWSAFVSASRLYSDGFRRNTFTDSYSVFMSIGYFGEKDFLKLTAFDANAKNGLGYGGVLESDLEADPRTNYLNENDTDDFGQQLLQLQHTHTFTSDLDLTSSVYYGASGGDFLFTFPRDSVNFDQINFPLFNDHYGVMSTLFWSPMESLEVNLGVHAFKFDRINQESNTANFANPYYEESSSKSEFSTFAKVTYALNRLKLFADVQLRTQQLTISPDYSFIGIPSEGDIAKNWTFFNPKVGLDYQVNESLSLFGSFGRTGREPTRLDILGGAFNLTGANLDLAQSDAFNPEFVNDLELGTRYSANGIQINANYFYMDFENEIAPYGEVVAFGVQRRINIPNSTRAGLELDARYAMGTGLEAHAHVTYMQSNVERLEDIGTGEVFTDVKPILAPDWIFGGGVSYTLLETVQFGLSARGISESFLEISNDEDLVLPSYGVLDFQLGLELGFVEINLEVNNLGDNVFYTSGNPVDVDFDGAIDGPGYIVNAGRNYFLTTRFNF